MEHAGRCPRGPHARDYHTLRMLRRGIGIGQPGNHVSANAGHDRLSLARITLKIARRLVKVKWITLVNLLAREAVFPEFITDRDPSIQLAARVIQMLNDPSESVAVRRKLADLCDDLQSPELVKLRHDAS